MVEGVWCGVCGGGCVVWGVMVPVVCDGLFCAQQQEEEE